MSNKKSFLTALLGTAIFGLSLSTATAFAEEPTSTATDCTVLSLNNVCMSSFDDTLTSIKNTTPNYIKLYSDIDDTGTSLYQFKAYTDTTIDLNGHNIYTSRSFLIYGATVNLTGNGKISINNGFPFNFLGSTTASASNFTVFNVDSGVELEGASEGSWDMMSMAYTGSYLTRKYGITINYNGKVTQKVPTSVGDVLYVNGQYAGTGLTFYWGPTAYANTTAGMYVAGGADVTYAGTMELQKAGIEIRGGSLNVIGGSISVDASQPYTLRPNPNSGMAALGTALVVTQHTTKLPINIAISGGSFVADKPFVELDAVNNGDDSYATVTGSISGGNFYSTSDKDTVESKHWSEFITGGDYTPARLEQSYIHPLYEDEEINTEYWRVYPREIDMNNKTITNNGSEDVASSVSLESEVLADRKYPVEFTSLDDDTISNAKEKNPQITNLIAGTSINILRDNGDKVLVTDNNEVTLSLGVTKSQYDILKDFDLVYAHFLDDDGFIDGQYPATLDTVYDNETGKKYYMVTFKIMGLGTSTYIISGEYLPTEPTPAESGPDHPSSNPNETTSADLSEAASENSPNIPNTGISENSLNSPKTPDTGAIYKSQNYSNTIFAPAAILSVAIALIFFSYNLKKAFRK